MGISLVQAGFLLSIVQLAGMSLGLVVGLGADSWGLRRSLLAGLFLLAMASIVGAFATTYPFLLALRAVEGLGFLLVVMPAPALIRRSVPPSLMSARMGWWGSYMPLGSAVGLVLGPWVLAAWSWPVWWCVLGAVSVLAWVSVWRGVPDVRAPAAPSAAPSSAAVADAGWRPRLRLTLRTPGPWLVSIGFAMYSGQWIAVIGFLPTVYAEGGLSATTSGLLTALVAVSNMVGNVASGRLLQRGWAPAQLLRIGYVCMGLCAAAAFAQWNGQPMLPLALRFLSVVLFSAVGGLIPGTLFTTAVHLSPSEGTVSTTVGFMQQWSAAGQFFGPPIVAAVATWAGGWQWTGAVACVLCLVGLGVAWGIAANRGGGRPAP
jgi:CP family cyanate transporter-like MFS transporter